VLEAFQTQLTNSGNQPF
jgi:hypothetical protein